MVDGGAMAQVRAITVQPARVEVYAALQYAASFPLRGGRMARMLQSQSKAKDKWTFVNKNVEAKKIEWSGMRLQAHIVA